LVHFTGWAQLDAITAIGVGLAVAWSGWSLLQEALLVAMDAVPQGIAMDEVAEALGSLPGVEAVHHLHVWGLSTSQNALTAHLKRQVGAGDDMELLHQAKQRLAQLGIAHCTIQLEPVGAQGSGDEG
jgi:cobalt-zinc-cadmium efflux system protein